MFVIRFVFCVQVSVGVSAGVAFKVVPNACSIISGVLFVTDTHDMFF